MKNLAMILLVVVVLGSWATPSFASSPCVCGARKVLLVLADFPEYPHLSGRDEIANLFFLRVGRYIYDVSYGRLSITGNSTQWITLPKLHSQYVGPDPHAEVLAIARDAFNAASRSMNLTVFDYVVLVLSLYPSLTGDFVQSYGQPIVTKNGSINAFEVIEEDRDWSAYARGFALLLGLWQYQVQVSGFGSLDMAANGEGDMSTWSKFALGWINDSQILAEETPPTHHIVTVGAVELTGADHLGLRIDLGEGLGQYWIDVRQPFGYDRDTLREFGAVVSFVRLGNESIQVRKVLQPDVIGKAIFIDPNAPLSIVVLNETLGRFRLLVGDAEDGRNAEVALFAISRASDAVLAAKSENKLKNLDLAERLLLNARTLFTAGQFQQADALAISAETTANAATVPAEYYQAVQLIATAQTLKNETSNLNSPQTSTIVIQANADLDTAKKSFEAQNFTFTIQTAQAAIDLFNHAKQLDFTTTITAWLSNFALIIPVIILAYALRYQLKRD